MTGTRNRLSCLLVWPALVLTHVALAAAQTAPVYSKDENGRIVVRATRIAQPIAIDGRLDDAAYREVEAITAFVQQEPNEGEPVSQPTEAWIFFDDRNLYIACRCWESRPERIV